MLQWTISIHSLQTHREVIKNCENITALRMPKKPGMQRLQALADISRSALCCQKVIKNCENITVLRMPKKPGMERLQALADILCSALCCDSNATCAPIANPPDSEQLECTAYHSPALHPGPCSSVGMQRGTDTQTHRQTDARTAVTTIHFASATPHAKCNETSYYAGNSSIEVRLT